MRKFLLIIICGVLSAGLTAQRKADYGVLAGVTSYIGDINPSRMLYSPGPAAGFFYRYNIHPRHSVRADILYGLVSANDLDFTNSFQQTRGASFSGSVTELAVQFEFNFYPYSSQGKKYNYSPFLAAGAGLSMVNTAGLSYVPILPFSAGFKINIFKNIGLEAECGFRKSFYDNFDGLKDSTDPVEKPWIHNNDWYMFTGIGLTWKIYNRLAGCPAYGDTDKTRRK
jgi:hypothetical protein